MKIVITGSEGNIGRALKRIWPDAIGIDWRGYPDLRCDLRAKYMLSHPIPSVLGGADAVIHLATSPDPGGPVLAHLEALTITARLVETCAQLRVPRLILPSSGWAEPAPGWPQEMTAYGHSKRAIEEMAAMYRAAGLHCVALRYGWYAERFEDLPQDAAPALLASWWGPERLECEMRAALTDPTTDRGEG
ncbi:NAD-dependent epimerase/dehydratase family protein [Xanthobacter flavus]|uniref:NAD-dependent epimerase/dehydratase family protein n=1 Tax=Xanthobacter flavus TaxID=281 RepID=UPI00372A106D